ncbi:MAG: PKD domain-containing protein [Bacteroidaceae bacterium]|nr:PKD domain-containing protein [Bacteroidaceae bacterium]
MATDQGLWEAPLYHQNFIPVPQPMALNLGCGDLTSAPYKEVQFDSYSIVRQDEETKWLWSFSPQPYYVSDASVRNPRVVFGNAGSYDVTLSITNAQGTASRTIKNMIKIDGATGIDKERVGEVGIVKTVLSQGEKLEFVTYGLHEEATLTIHNIKGHQLHREGIWGSKQRISIPSEKFPPSVYIYSISTASKKFFGQFIIK